jgi:3-oxoacyl-[acyl-carrier-protein] synthase II
LKRVVITGLGAVSPLGKNVSVLMNGLDRQQSAIRHMPDWNQYIGLRCHAGAPAPLPDIKKIPRKSRRSMGRMSFFSVEAATEALNDAGIPPDAITDGKTGCIIGSTMGGAESLVEAFEIMLPEHDLTRLSSMKFFQCVSHTAVMNVAQCMGIKGFVLATAAACASALQAIGTGYDLIRSGRQDIVLCGGAEELHPAVAGSFDILFAASTHYNDHPEKTPRPFDQHRDGLVCGEGAGIVVLEDYDRARERGAVPYAEITGYHTCGSGFHISHSENDAMISCMEATLAEAGLSPNNIDYVNAHATATVQGDKEEAAAIREVFGDAVPVSSLKGYIGHTLGASGAIELIAALQMMRRSTIYPTLNLETVAEDCQGINHITQKQTASLTTILKNCFAFGGINSSIIVQQTE